MFMEALLARLLLLSFHLEILKTLVHSLVLSPLVTVCQEQSLQGFTHYSPFLSFQLEHGSMFWRSMRLGRLGSWSVAFGRRRSLSPLSPQAGILVCFLVICDVPESWEGDTQTHFFIFDAKGKGLSFLDQHDGNSPRSFVHVIFITGSSVMKRVFSQG